MFDFLRLDNLKILFACQIVENNTNGVWKKVQAQVKALREIYQNVDFIYLEDAKTAVFDNGETQVKIPLINKYMVFSKITNVISNDYDMVYLRKPHGGLFPVTAAFFIKKIKKKKDSTIILLEIPTYPYKSESKGFIGWVKEKIFELSVHAVKDDINEILYIGENTRSILGINARSIGNGVDLNNVRKVDTKSNNDSFVFLGIANLMFWHGYDRLIKALGKYSGSKKVLFYIVGDTEPEFSRLKILVKQSNLEKNVIFLGKKNKDEIIGLLEQTNVCVDALGRHRSGNNVNDSLKSKEYSAMGIPFIKSHIDYSLGNPFFVYQVSSDESDIDVDKIIEWYTFLPSDMNEKIRNYAESNFSWKSIMKKAIDGDDES